LSLGEAISKIFTFVSFTYLGRNFGPAVYGEVEFSLSITLVFALFLQMGLGSYGTREIARRPESARQLLGEIIEVRLLLALISVSVIFCFAWLVDKPVEVKLLMAAFGVSLLVLPAMTIWFFQAHEAMHWVAAINLSKHVVFAALVLSSVRPDSPLWIIGAMETAALLAAAALGVVLIRQSLGYSRPRVGLNLQRSLDHFRSALPIGLADLGWAALWQSPMVVLGLRLSDDSLGWFGAAHRCTMALHTFVWWYFFNLLPSVSRTADGPRESLRALLEPSIKLAAWGGVSVALTGGLVASDVLGLAYGAEYSAGGPVLAALLWGLPLAALCGHYRAVLIGYGLQQPLFERTLVAAVVGAGAAYLLSPIWGALGAVAGLVAGNLTVLILSYRVAAHRVVDLRFAGPAAAPLLGAAGTYALSATGGSGAAAAGVAAFVGWMLWANRDQARIWFSRLRAG